MIDSTGYNWIMNKEYLEVMRVVFFKRKIKLRGKRKYISTRSGKLIWNPFLKTEYLVGSDKQ